MTKTRLQDKKLRRFLSVTLAYMLGRDFVTRMLLACIGFSLLLPLITTYEYKDVLLILAYTIAAVTVVCLLLIIVMLLLFERLQRELFRSLIEEKRGA